MKKLSALLLLALVVVACGGGGTTAITINGTSATVADIESMFVRSDPFTKAEFASHLNFYAHYAVLPAAVKDAFDVEFSDEEIEVEAQSVVTANSAVGQSREAFLAERGVTELYLKRFAHLQLLDAAIAENLRADIEADMEPTPPVELDEEEMEVARLELSEVCASHILPKNLSGLGEAELEAAKEEARTQTQDLIDRIKAGEKFEDLAREFGTDGTAAAGGELGCSSPSAWVAGFREAAMEAPIGEVVDEPVESEFGFHVLLVSERTIPTDQEVIDGVTEFTHNQAIDTELRTVFETWVFDTMRGATIEVNSRFGTWQTEPRPLVVAPA